jgi:hypothetical protein
MALPPIHRIDAEPIFIHPLDSAWDTELKGREERILAGAEPPPDGEPLPWLTLEEHPLTRYWTGESRGDLATVRRYLLADQTPTMFRCQRLPLTAFNAIRNIVERKDWARFYTECVRHGLVAVDNALDTDGKAVALARHPLTDDDINLVRKLVGDGAGGFDQLALFIWGVSKEPSPAELFA